MVGICTTLSICFLFSVAMVNQTHQQTVAIPEEIEMLNEEIQRIREVINSVSSHSIKEALEAAIRTIESQTIKLRNQVKCTCDWEYEEADPDCLACLNQYRNERYGYNVHDVECSCNDCTYGSYGYPRADY